MASTDPLTPQPQAPQAPSPPAHHQRLASFEEPLASSQIKLSEIRRLAFTGVPESLRPAYWKVLLGYMPLRKDAQEHELATKRALYQGYKDEFLTDPRLKSDEQDHPLCTAVQSKWNEFFKNQDMVDQIDKDVRRTFPSLHFFRGEHGDALRRLLFIYARLNPGILYVQGMNEIMGPIYYVFANDQANASYAEADAFFCFSGLMGEIMDNFCKHADSSSQGVHRTIEKIYMLAQHFDEQVWRDMEDKALDPRFYCLRWVTLLFSQEFPLPEILRLWDSLFADPNRFEMMHFFACAMIIAIRDQILEGTFEDNLFLLQNYPVTDVGVLLQKATELRDSIDPLTLSSIMDSPALSGLKRLGPADPRAVTDPALLLSPKKTHASCVTSLAAGSTVAPSQAPATRKKFHNAIPEGFLPPPAPL